MAEALAGRPATPRPIPSEDWRALNHDLARAVVDLHGPASTGERFTALARLLALAFVLGGGVVVHWSLPAGGWGLAALFVAGVAYALLLIATHEMVHGTLLGCKRLEFGLGCLLSWPMAWPFATYARLHNLHHRWNGRDGRDPERTQRLATDPAPRGGGALLLESHPFAIRCLLLGGVGLIIDTARKGWRLRGDDGGLNGARLLDGFGTTLLHGSLLLLVIQKGVLPRYLLFWIVLERVIGAIVQYRGLVEHHGLWPEEEPNGVARAWPARMRQLATSRDVAASGWFQSLMGGLPHHSTHHAFPAIPTARLPEASARLAAVLKRHHWPLPHRLSSYGAALAGLNPQGQPPRLP